MPQIKIYTLTLVALTIMLCSCATERRQVATWYKYRNDFRLPQTPVTKGSSVAIAQPIAGQTGQGVALAGIAQPAVANNAAPSAVRVLRSQLANFPDLSTARAIEKKASVQQEAVAMGTLPVQSMQIGLDKSSIQLQAMPQASQAPTKATKAMVGGGGFFATIGKVIVYYFLIVIFLTVILIIFS
jgi:hypothetical protein